MCLIIKIKVYIKRQRGGQAQRKESSWVDSIQTGMPFNFQVITGAIDIGFKCGLS